LTNFLHFWDCAWEDDGVSADACDGDDEAEAEADTGGGGMVEIKRSKRRRVRVSQIVEERSGLQTDTMYVTHRGEIYKSHLDSLWSNRSSTLESSTLFSPAAAKVL
jgi:hypothetical protein